MLLSKAAVVLFVAHLRRRLDALPLPGCVGFGLDAFNLLVGATGADMRYDWRREHETLLALTFVICGAFACRVMTVALHVSPILSRGLTEIEPVIVFEVLRTAIPRPTALQDARFAGATRCDFDGGHLIDRPLIEDTVKCRGRP
jgi:hypothetical protein